MMHVQKNITLCICWCLSISELKNLRWNVKNWTKILH